MELGEASFDKAVSFCVIEHFENDGRVLQNIARALRPGGRLALSADSLSNPELRPAELEAHRKRYAARTFYTREILEEKLGRAGLDLLKTRYIQASPLTLALVRLSWKMDDLPRAVEPFVVVGKVALGTIGQPAAALAERLSERRDSGLTILAIARKPELRSTATSS